MPITFSVEKIGDPKAFPVLSFDSARVVIGRRDSSDLRLPDRSVSGRHASVRVRDNGFAIVDEGSTNGTFVNGERLTPQVPHTLTTGDLVRVGRFELRIKVGAARASSMGKTRALAAAIVGRLTGQGDQLPTINVQSGPDIGRTTTISPTPFRIGRDPRVDFRLTDRAVPPMALEIDIVSSSLMARVLDEAAGVTCNDQVQKNEFVVRDADVIRIGETLLLVADPIAKALAEAENEPDQPIDAESKSVTRPISVEEDAELNANLGHKKHDLEANAPTLPPPKKPSYDRRKSWRWMTSTIEIVILLVGLIVLLFSTLGLLWVFGR